MTNVTLYRKDEELRRRINAFLQLTFELPDSDYYAKLDTKSLLMLKSALSDINNALTMQLTLGFLDWVATALPLDLAAISRIRSAVLSTKPSSNGYDIHCYEPIPFVAEVKCNIPINGGNLYGAAQKAGILKDVEALLQGKSKGFPVSRESLKFMVFLDLPEVRAANEHLVRSNSKISKAFRLLVSGEVPSDPAVVYGVHAALGG